MESRAALETKDPMRHHTHYVKRGKDQSPYAGGSSFMERVAEGVADGVGDRRVRGDRVRDHSRVGADQRRHPLLESTFTNLSHGKQFDPEPWILSEPRSSA